MQTGDIIALVSYMTQILLAMIVVANLVLLMTKGSASAARINEVLETEPSVKETTKEIISVNTDETHRRLLLTMFLSVMAAVMMSLVNQL